MGAISVRTRVIFNHFPQKKALLHQRVGQVVEATLANLRADMVDSMKGIDPPSPEGGPPAIDTGLLSNSIDHRRISDLKGIVFTNTEYAPHLEYGTVKMAPRPFMAPAADRQRPEWERAIRLAVRGL